MLSQDVFHDDDLETLQHMLARENVADDKLCEHYLRRLRFYQAGARTGGPLGPLALAALLDDLGYESPHERAKPTPMVTDWDRIEEGRLVKVNSLGQEWTGVFAGHVNGLLIVVTKDNVVHEVMPCYATPLRQRVEGVLEPDKKYIDPEPPEPRKVPTPEVDVARAAEAAAGEQPEEEYVAKLERAPVDTIAAHDDGREPEKVEDPTSDEDELITGWRKIKPGARCIVETDLDILDMEYICVSPEKEGELMVRDPKTNEVKSVIVDAVQLADNDEPVAATT